MEEGHAQGAIDTGHGPIDTGQAPEDAQTMPEVVAQSLKACASTLMDCRRCHKEFGLGCARDLKLEAATMIEELAETAKEAGG